VAAGVLDATRPQVVIYEPTPDGHLQLIGADFLVIASDWDKAHPDKGRRSSWDSSFIILRAQSLRASSVLHASCVGMEGESNGAFVNWHPNVSCQAFAGQ